MARLMRIHDSSLIIQSRRRSRETSNLEVTLNAGWDEPR